MAEIELAQADSVPVLMSRPTTPEGLDALTGNGYVMFQTPAQAAAVGIPGDGVLQCWEPWLGVNGWRMQVFTPRVPSSPILRRWRLNKEDAVWSAWA